jgi:DNA-binding NarL/FixJ family response regulator
MTPTKKTDEGAKMQILIVDDHPGVALGYGLVFQKRGHDANTACTFSEAMKICHRDRPQVLLVDLHLPDRDGVSLVHATREAKLRSRVVLITGDESDRVIRAAMLSKPDGFVHKSDTMDDIVGTVLNAARGRSGVTARIAKAKRGTPQNDAEAWLTEVTPAEREVWVLVAKGRTLKEISDILSKSESTIDNQRTRLMRRLGVHKSSELTRLAVEAGLL